MGLQATCCLPASGRGRGSGSGEHLCASCDVSGVRISHMHRLSVGSSSNSGRQQAAASQEGHSPRTLTSQAVRRLRCSVAAAANDAALCMVISATLDYTRGGVEGQGNGRYCPPFCATYDKCFLRSEFSTVTTI